MIIFSTPEFEKIGGLFFLSERNGESAQQEYHLLIFPHAPEDNITTISAYKLNDPSIWERIKVDLVTSKWDISNIPDFIVSVRNKIMKYEGNLLVTQGLPVNYTSADFIKLIKLGDRKKIDPNIDVVEETMKTLRQIQDWKDAVLQPDVLQQPEAVLSGNISDYADQKQIIIARVPPVEFTRPVEGQPEPFAEQKPIQNANEEPVVNRGSVSVQDAFDNGSNESFIVTTEADILNTQFDLGHIKVKDVKPNDSSKSFDEILDSFAVNTMETIENSPIEEVKPEVKATIEPVKEKDDFIPETHFLRSLLHIANGKPIALTIQELANGELTISTSIMGASPIIISGPTHELVDGYLETLAECTNKTASLVTNTNELIAQLEEETKKLKEKLKDAKSKKGGKDKEAKSTKKVEEAGDEGNEDEEDLDAIEDEVAPEKPKKPEIIQPLLF